MRLGAYERVESRTAQVAFIEQIGCKILGLLVVLLVLGKITFEKHNINNALNTLFDASSGTTLRPNGLRVAPPCGDNLGGECPV